MKNIIITIVITILAVLVVIMFLSWPEEITNGYNECMDAYNEGIKYTTTSDDVVENSDGLIGCLNNLFAGRMIYRSR